MGIIKTEDIIAYQIGEELCCTDCATADEIKNVAEDDITQESHRDEGELIFCDRCKKQI